MTALRPCRRCHRRETCPVRADTLKSLRGLSITLANLRCGIPKEDFPIGSTVSVKAFEIVENDREDQVKVDVFKIGVVRSWRNNKANVVLNAGQEIEKIYDGGKIGYLSVETDRLTRVDAPIVELCGCGIAQERCENSDYPPVRNGEWNCWEAQRERDESRHW